MCMAIAKDADIDKDAPIRFHESTTMSTILPIIMLMDAKNLHRIIVKSMPHDPHRDSRPLTPNGTLICIMGMEWKMKPLNEHGNGQKRLVDG